MGNKNSNFINNKNSFQTEQEKINFATDNDKRGSLSTSEIKTNYHVQRLVQSQWAFWLSFGGSIVGFLVMLWSIWYGVKNGDTQWPGIVSGTVIEGVSALFYTISNKANEKISEFFTELTKDVNVDKAIDLANSIEDEEIQGQLNAKLALHLAGIDDEKICKNIKEVCNKKDENT